MNNLEHSVLSEVKTNIMKATKTKFGLPTRNSITASSEDLRGAPTKETFGRRGSDENKAGIQVTISTYNLPCLV